MSTDKHRITAARTYYTIARRHSAFFHQYDKMSATLEDVPTSEETAAKRLQEIETHYERQQEATMIAVTFSAMALEAFWYDYAADQPRRHIRAGLPPRHQLLRKLHE